jgi:hypothetical protein
VGLYNMVFGENKMGEQWAKAIEAIGDIIGKGG